MPFENGYKQCIVGKEVNFKTLNCYKRILYLRLYIETQSLETQMHSDASFYENIPDYVGKIKGSIIFIAHTTYFLVLQSM